MPKFIIYFNQQWVGDHTPEWFQSRGPHARKAVEEIQKSGALVFAGGVEEEIDSENEAKLWGSKIAKACSWPQEIRKIVE